ncbi:hypothetical protein GA565_08325 [Rouxiella sp. S1S-2]|uniref:hypothetical protein n=1 Tax=Rouxiella sp. S1S-2 TaxID=2653856 RepID=UPI00126563A2|nr:hypothetical protein [Rouxiella sp. S1S-2]KAB7895993.1 hypothetical protein GA565_08325 [Rouxiella sp. S1S-2]
MKPYIMLYSETIEKIEINHGALLSMGHTSRTFTIESSDDDSATLKNWTTITKVNEASDQDQISPSTIRTNTTESSDEDYISNSFIMNIHEVKKYLKDNTFLTEYIESSDEDSINTPKKPRIPNVLNI